MDKRRNIYFTDERWEKVLRVYDQLRKDGVLGSKDDPNKSLALIVEYALDKTIEGIDNGRS